MSRISKIIGVLLDADSGKRIGHESDEPIGPKLDSRLSSIGARSDFGLSTACRQHNRRNGRQRNGKCLFPPELFICPSSHCDHEAQQPPTRVGKSDPVTKERDRGEPECSDGKARGRDSAKKGTNRPRHEDETEVVRIVVYSGAPQLIHTEEFSSFFIQARSPFCRAKSFAINKFMVVKYC